MVGQLVLSQFIEARVLAPVRDLSPHNTLFLYELVV